MTKAKIVRRPDFAGGGITDAERAAMAEHVKLWTARAMRTDPIVPDRIGSAIRDLYAAAGLKAPRVVIVPSPIVMAFAGGFAAGIWWLRKNGRATYAATLDENRWPAGSLHAIRSTERELGELEGRIKDTTAYLNELVEELNRREVTRYLDDDGPLRLRGLGRLRLGGDMRPYSKLTSTPDGEAKNRAR
jgi:hypothetical protein